MSDVGAGTEESKLDEIAERLARIELLIVESFADEVEGNEPPETVGAESLSLDATAVLAALSPAAEFEQFVDGLDLEHFQGAEFTPYWSRVKKGVSNSVPPRKLWKNIAPTLAVLQHFRREVGSPVQMLSTFRSVAYNKAVGGAGDSQHSHFRAIDFTAASGTPAQWAKRLRGYRGRKFTNPHDGTSFTFHGGVGLYSGFVHLDTRGTDADW